VFVRRFALSRKAF